MRNRSVEGLFGLLSGSIANYTKLLLGMKTLVDKDFPPQKPTVLKTVGRVGYLVLQH